MSGHGSKQRLCMALLCALWCACVDTKPATEVTVVVSADSTALVQRLATVRAWIYPEDATEERESLDDHAFSLSAGEQTDGTLQLPFSFGIRKRKADGFLLVIRGYEDGRAEPIIERKVSAQFEDEKTRLLLIVLSEKCVNPPQKCAALDQTCYPEAKDNVAAGACGPVAQGELKPVVRGSELDASPAPVDMDGGEPDADPPPDANPPLDVGPDTDAPADATPAPAGDAAIASEGTSCAVADAKACGAANGRQRLLCSSGSWMPSGSCDGETRCQTRLDAPEVGTCQPVVAACVGKQPGDVVCDGSTRRACGPDLLDYASNPCPAHASCSVQAGTPTCSCDTPYFDDGAGGCTTQACMQMPCQNAGICNIAGSGRSCDCSMVDYQGTSCETKIDNCALTPCMNGGTCTDGVRARSCNCGAVDYQGTHCETRIDDCTLTPCAHGSCTDGVRSRSCDCANTGFSGTACQTNTNECAGTNICTGTANGIAYSFPCQDLTGDIPGYSCRGQFPDWLTPPASASRFSASGGVVTDAHTGFRWQQAVDAGTYTWDQARSYCTGLALASGGWRLPTRAELLSIVDYGRFEPAIDGSASAFPGTPNAHFWAASAYVGMAGSAWIVDFGYGTTYSVSTGNANRVRCVR